MSSAVAIGYRDDILPFGVWGIRLIPVASEDELIPTLDRTLSGTPPALIILSEAVVVGAGLEPTLSSYIARSPIPIVILPTHRGSYGTSLRETASLIKTAIGIDILERENKGPITNL
ncbi:MAG: hypothetical protein ACK4WF_05610 [Candidatus Brocadiales bacterium]